MASFDLQRYLDRLFAGLDRFEGFYIYDTVRHKYELCLRHKQSGAISCEIVEGYLFDESTVDAAYSKMFSDFNHRESNFASSAAKVEANEPKPIKTSKKTYLKNKSYGIF